MTARPGLSAHIGYMFGEYRLEERFAAAARAGFDAVEHPHPFALPAPAVKALLEDNGLRFSQLAVGAEVAGGPGKGLAALPGQERAFREALLHALDYAEAIGCPYIHPMAGMPQAAAEEVEPVYRDNIAFAVEMCEGRGPSVLIEPISRKVVPDYHLHRLEQAAGLAGQFAPGAVSILFDAYHAAMDGVDGVAAIGAYAHLFGHIHIADCPGRHEPGSGTLDFPALLGALRASGYRGAIGFEYIPAGDTEQGLGWLPEWKRQIAA